MAWGWGIYDLGEGIHGLNGWDLNRWDMYSLDGKAVIANCCLEDMLKKKYWSSGEYRFQSLHDHRF